MKLRKAIIAYWVINLALGGAHAWSQLDVQSSDSTNLTGSLAATFYGELIGGTQETSTEFWARDYFGEPRKDMNARKERNAVVLSFFATWCKPCKKEIPELEKLQTEFPQTKFFLVNVGEKREEIEDYLLKHPLRLPIILDRFGKTAEKYGVKSKEDNLAVLPTLVLIDAKGRISFYKKGYVEGDEFKIREQVLSLINY